MIYLTVTLCSAMGEASLEHLLLIICLNNGSAMHLILFPFLTDLVLTLRELLTLEPC